MTCRPSSFSPHQPSYQYAYRPDHRPASPRGRRRHPSWLGRHDPLVRQDRLPGAARRLRLCAGGLPQAARWPTGAWERFGDAHPGGLRARSTGAVRADARSPGGYELTASDVVVTAPSVDYPITPKEHGTSFLFEHRHLWLRSRKQVAIARVRHEVEQAIQRLLLRPRLHPSRHADPHRLDRRRGRRALRHRVLRPWPGVPRADGSALCRGDRRRPWKGLLLRADLPRREEQDTTPPDRVLDVRTRDGVRRHRREHGGCRRRCLLPRRAGARASQGGAQGTRARSRPAREGSPPRSRASPTPRRSPGCRPRAATSSGAPISAPTTRPRWRRRTTSRSS